MHLHLYRIILPVTDIEKASEFYGSVLSMQGQRISAGRHYFNLGGTFLACYDPKADGDDDHPRWQPHFNQYIYISTDQLEQVFKRIKKAGASEVDPRIEIMPWGERLFYAQDPFGNPICFVDEKTVFTGD